jgi:hypothetical protein
MTAVPDYGFYGSVSVTTDPSCIFPTTVLSNATGHGWKVLTLALDRWRGRRRR